MTYDNNADALASPNASVDRRAPPSPRRIDSKDLFGAHRQIDILHRGEIYRLCLTRQGKLILTK
ncbi:MAG TPA: hemin uptake protein HemP [Rhodocyclaceae bacterium]|nr:hemin uptake protein HemP [Rhodocyclaceae bacterium]